MFDEVNQAVNDYMNKWQGFVGQRKNKDLFERLKPTCVAWKVADLAEYDRTLHDWRSQADRVIETWINGRWIALFALRDTRLSGDIQILELMQRRPDGQDELGLTHVDFMDMEETNTKAILEEEGIEWVDGENGAAVWTSVKFEGLEAKLRRGTILDVVIGELDETNNKIRGPKFANPIGDPGVAHVSEVE